MEPNTLGNILAIEEEKQVGQILRDALPARLSNLDEATDNASAINHINHKIYDLIILDMELHGVNGFEILAHVHAHANSTPVVVLTGSNDRQLAATVMKQGAYDCLTKPFIEEELVFAVTRALDFRLLRTSVEIYKRSRQQKENGEEVIGESDAWLKVTEKLRRFAKTDLVICLEGETGTEKEVLAQYIHRNSQRKEQPYIVVDCGTMTGPRIESELFGYEKGTGDGQPEEGLVELAHGGTLFLHEACDIDPEFQQKLLKFMETKAVSRPGGKETRIIDVRVIVSTSRNLEEEHKHGRFPLDRWNRLGVIKLRIPPLRERKSDIHLLAEYFLKLLYSRAKMKRISSEALALLESYHWPGNTTELQSVLHRAIVVSKNNLIHPKDLNIYPAPLLPTYESTGIVSPIHALQTVEKCYIESVLSSVQGNVSLAAKILKISRTTLYSRLKHNGYMLPQMK